MSLLRHTDEATEILIQKQTGSRRQVCCIQDVVTRWWSTYSMCVRLIRLRPYFAAMTQENTLPASVNLTAAQWYVVKDTVAMLEPFRVKSMLPYPLCLSS